MKFKAEMCLLVLAIMLFGASAFFYSYQPTSEELALNIELIYPYRLYAITFVGFGSILTFVASISYSRRCKNLDHTSY